MYLFMKNLINLFFIIGDHGNNCSVKSIDRQKLPTTCKRIYLLILKFIMIRICNNCTWFPNSNWRKRFFTKINFGGNVNHTFIVFGGKGLCINQRTGFFTETEHAQIPNHKPKF
jgi:hypothetical protein